MSYGVMGPADQLNSERSSFAPRGEELRAGALLRAIRKHDRWHGK